MIPRRTTKHDGAQAVPLRRFVTDDGVGLDRFFRRTPGYPNQEVAARAWRRHRHAVWAMTHRMCVPAAAQVYDEISFESFHAVWGQLGGAIAFDLARADEAIASDRAALADFRAADPVAAASINDFLAIVEHDLDALYQAALAAVAGRTEEACRLATASTKFTYGEGGQR